MCTHHVPINVMCCEQRSLMKSLHCIHVSHIGRQASCNVRRASCRASCLVNSFSSESTGQMKLKPHVKYIHNIAIWYLLVYCGTQYFKFLYCIYYDNDIVFSQNLKFKCLCKLHLLWHCHTERSEFWHVFVSLWWHLILFKSLDFSVILLLMFWKSKLSVALNIHGDIWYTSIKALHRTSIWSLNNARQVFTWSNTGFVVKMSSNWRNTQAKCVLMMRGQCIKRMITL